MLTFCIIKCIFKIGCIYFLDCHNLAKKYQNLHYYCQISPSQFDGGKHSHTHTHTHSLYLSFNIRA